jgi:hypothetical protein
MQDGGGAAAELVELGLGGLVGHLVSLDGMSC